MMRLLSFIAVLCSFLMSCSEQPEMKPVIRIDAAWARPASVPTEPVVAGSAQPSSIGPSAVYLHLQNRGRVADQLLQARAEVAGTVEIHQSREENGIVRMQHVEYVEVPAGETVIFEPGGYHIMLMNLKRPLQIGDSFPVMLVFKRSGVETVQVAVREQ